MPFVRAFLAAASGLLALVLGLGIVLQPLKGDLTRLGRLSERSWGWNASTPALALHANAHRADARLLVVGDSFSAGNAWQSVVERDGGLPVVSYHWDDLGTADCLRDAVLALKQRHPLARQVVVQVIERAFMDRFGDKPGRLRACKPELASSIIIEPRDFPTRRATFQFDRLAPDPAYLLHAARAEFAATTSLHALGPVVVAPLSRAGLFSNRRSAELLYYREDLAKPKWPVDQINAALLGIRRLSDDLAGQGLALTVMVVPDKSTAYSAYMTEPAPLAPVDLWDGLDRAGVSSVNLRAVFAGELPASVDFYWPNDTHVGVVGYLSMGRAVIRHLHLSPSGKQS